MLDEMLLQSYPALSTRDADEMRRFLEPIFSITQLSFPLGANTTDFVFNFCPLPSIGLAVFSSGSPFKGGMEQSDYFVQSFPITGRGKARWNGREQLVSPQTGGFVGGPGSCASLEYDERFAYLILKIAPEILTRKLSALAGIPVEPAIKLIGSTNPGLVARERRLALFLAREIEHANGSLPDPVIAELEDAIIVNYLLESEHNHSHLLRGTPRALAPWQVRRAADYMEQHWDEAITIEKLTEVTESSARSLFQLFKKTYDMSPMVYLGKVRLQRAREMLCRPESGTNVTKVGFMCGFSNLGTFAMRYQAAFGERPSETLRKSIR